MARCSLSEPLEKFRFILEVEGFARAGFHDCQMPKRTTNRISYRDGTDTDINTISAGLSTMEDIVLSRGLLIGTDEIGDFYAWIRKIHKPVDIGNVKPTDGSNGAEEYRKSVKIRMLDRDGNVARAWLIYNAFPVNYVPGSDLNAGEDADKTMESLTLTYEDFEELKPSDAIEAIKE